MSEYFDPVKGMDVTVDTVRAYREALGIGLTDAKNIAKANALYSELADMRYRLGRFKEMSAEEILNELLEIFMRGTGSA